MNWKESQADLFFVLVPRTHAAHQWEDVHDMSLTAEVAAASEAAFDVDAVDSELCWPQGALAIADVGAVHCSDHCGGEETVEELAYSSAVAQSIRQSHTAGSKRELSSTKPYERRVNPSSARSTGRRRESAALRSIQLVAAVAQLLARAACL
eukprot:CAMPEP_0182835202 /NCGR_PEP_ID=MMETSP0006_2-20121128/21366_1 /TAXON_ID=97485 /ORGANISM="Prymnesium parvum, Strain Texoma1" /LENGTH=151 /DNA_ID=CAMNT_0024963587 /DNA_START=455 /DNA_END=910 /DNA_ORIENTATION=+